MTFRRIILAVVHEAFGLARSGMKTNKSFCRGSRGTVFSKRVPLAAGGKKSIFIALLMFLVVGLLRVPVLAASDSEINIDSSLFGDIKARNIGPAVMSGRITDIRCVESNPDIIYIGTASGGLWKSIDKGITFEPVFDGYTMSIGCIAIDQKNPDIVWVGTGETNVRNSVSVGTGVYKTIDGGKTWQCMGLTDSERIGEVLIDPNDANTVFVAAAGHLWNANIERGLYKSIDGGKTWEKILYVDENTGCIEVDMHPQKSNILLAAMWEYRRQPWSFNSGGKGSGLFKSVDGGKTWKNIKKGLPEGILGRIAMDLSPSEPDLAYAIVEAKETALYKSIDAGDTWGKIGTSFGLQTRPFYFAKIEVDPLDPQRLYNPSLFLFISSNGGKSFDTLMNTYYKNTVHPDHHALWVNPHDPKHLLVGTDGGVYVSYNRGGTFRHLSNLPVSQFYHVSCDLEAPYRVYGGLQDNGSWYGPSQNIKASFIPNKSWEYVGSGDGFYAYRDPLDKDIVYASWQGGNLQRYDEKTAETADIKPMPAAGEPKYRFNWNAAVALSPTNKAALYIGAQYLFKSTDKGSHWTKISPDLTTDNPEKQQQEKSGGLTIDNTTAENHCTIITISESLLDENIIWVGTDDGNLQLTTNTGTKWENTVKNIKGLPPNTWCPGVEAGHYDKRTAYVVFDGHRTGDMKPYVYKTEDFGRTWISLVTPEIRGYCHVIREDPVNPQLLFLGTEFGLFVSFSGGRNWVHFKETLPKVAVMDMCIQPVEHDLVLATHGRGIYILDDITPLRNITEEVLQKEMAILPARPSYVTFSSFDFKMTGDTEFFGENPPKGAVITYYLKKRHIVGELKLEILNSKGEVVKTLPTGKRRGINRVFWNTSLRLPKLATTERLGGMVFSGPTVEPGIYSARLTRNKEILTTSLDIRPDKFTAHSAEDRLTRHNAVMKTYYMMEHLSYIADTVKGIKEDLEKILKEKEKDIPRKTKTFIEQQIKILSGIHGEIVDPASDLYSSEKLQGKVITIYSSILGYAGRPTESQLNYIKALDTELAGIEQRFKDFLEKNLPQINQQLLVLKIPEIKILSEEKYREELEK